MCFLNAICRGRIFSIIGLLKIYHAAGMCQYFLKNSARKGRLSDSVVELLLEVLEIKTERSRNLKPVEFQLQWLTDCLRTSRARIGDDVSLTIARRRIADVGDILSLNPCIGQRITHLGCLRDIG